MGTPAWWIDTIRRPCPQGGSCDLSSSVTFVAGPAPARPPALARPRARDGRPGPMAGFPPRTAQIVMATESSVFAPRADYVPHRDQEEDRPGARRQAAATGE